MKMLRVGVIGLGWFGARHARVYSQLPNTEVVGVCDADPQRLREISSVTGARRSLISTLCSPSRTSMP